MRELIKVNISCGSGLTGTSEREASSENELGEPKVRIEEGGKLYSGEATLSVH